MHQHTSSAVTRYFKNLIRQQFKTRKVQFTIAVLFIIILGISYFIPANHPARSKQPQTMALSVKEQYECALNRVVDGDTIVVHCPPSNKAQFNIRVWGIDAPEMKQKPWGENAKNALIKLLPQSNHATIKVEIIDIDRYSRYVGKLFYNNEDLGLALVKQGEAVVYSQYNKDSTYQKAEDRAKKSRLGIWGKRGSQQDPAAWRKLNPR